MAAISGRLAELWVATGAGSAFTTEACDVVAGTVYHITATTKRQWSPDTAILVYDNAVLQTSGYHLHPACGQIHFDSAPTTPVTVSGGYLTTAEVTLCQGFELNLESEVYETTSLGGSSYTCIGSGIYRWTGTINRLAEDNTWEARAVANGTKAVAKFYVDQPSTLVYCGWIVITSWNQNTSVGDVERETISFTGDGEITYLTSEA